jgi:excisionase family DNA binding protein
MIAPAETAVPKMALTIDEAAQALSVCPRTVSRLIERGELVRLSIGNRGFRVSTASIQKWIERQAQEQEAEANGEQ